MVHVQPSTDETGNADDIHLAQASEGAKVKVISIEAGRGLTSRLHDLGIREGSILRIHRSHYGSLIVGKNGSRYAMGRGVVEKVIVREV